MKPHQNQMLSKVSKDIGNTFKVNINVDDDQEISKTETNYFFQTKFLQPTPPTKTKGLEDQQCQNECR